MVSRGGRARGHGRRPPGRPALETSFANGGQISASHAEPWANPGAPWQVLRWLGREDAPLLFRPRADWWQWRWGLQFLIECLPSRTRRNTIQCLSLALYSRDCLRELRAATGIEYDHLERGILEVCTDTGDFTRAAATAEHMRRYGCEREVKSADECVAIEPALAACRARLAGGIYTASDESGDAQLFTAALAPHAAARGVAFRWRTTVAALDADASAVTGMRCVNERGEEQTLVADVYVMALGSYSPLLLRPSGHRGAGVPGQGLFADDRHRRSPRRADRVADGSRAQDRDHAARQPSARRGHRRNRGLRYRTQSGALRGVA